MRMGGDEVLERMQLWITELVTPERGNRDSIDIFPFIEELSPPEGEYPLSSSYIILFYCNMLFYSVMQCRLGALRNVFKI